MEARTDFLAKLLGCFCVLYGLAMFAHRNATLQQINDLLHSPGAFMILGVLTLVTGLALVLGHNEWSGGALPIAVTLIGWLSLLKGLVFVFLPPEGAAAYINVLRYEKMYYVYAFVSLAVGAYLLYAVSVSHASRRAAPARY